MKSHRGNNWTQILFIVISLILIVSMVLSFVAMAIR